MRSVRRYRSHAAAERAKNRIERDVPQARVEIEFDLSLTVWVYEAALTPTQRRALDGCEVKTPGRPSPSAPLLPPVKAREIQNPSKVERPLAVCREVFEEFWRDGRIDERKAAIEECVARGVTFNTAKTIYPQFRADKGLPTSVRVSRSRARRSPIALKAHDRPSAVRVCNGVSEPSEGSFAREVWDMADVLYRTLGRVPRRGEVAQRLPDVNEWTIESAFPQWRKFHALPYPGQYHKRG
jgi:hypothetical protein